jgi:PPK2 family polyphosphate:nucleotide phosphotransferase
VRPHYKSGKDAREKLAADVDDLRELQPRLYASGTWALLLIFQGMDTSGKDGAISHVLSGLNPEGCEAYSFKVPSAEESAHDFLWRTTCRLPARGRIGVFNRSYYEEVVVVRVHPHLLERQRLPGSEENSPHFWRHRCRSINDFERHLRHNGTRVLKFFLHLSKHEQRRRLVARIDDPDKNWKFEDGDVRERRRWRDYAAAYEQCLGHTSTRHAPWHIIPADDKLNARLIIARTVIETLRSLKLAMPKVSRARRGELRDIRRKLAPKS